MTTKKKQTKRSKVKYPALDITYMPRTRKEYMDVDYINKLNTEEKEWLNRFMNETLNASFSKTEDNLINDPKERKKIYNENNSRNRCVYSIARACGFVVDSETGKDVANSVYEEVTGFEDAQNYEDNYIDILDSEED